MQIDTHVRRKGCKRDRKGQEEVKGQEVKGRGVQVCVGGGRAGEKRSLATVINNYLTTN